MICGSQPPLPGESRWLEWEKFSDERGALTPIESGRHVPFEIRRVFYFYDIPSGEKRGSHAHRSCHQVIACLSGSFVVELDDGRRRARVTCDRPWRGLHVPPLVWASQLEFAGGTVGLVLASEAFEEADYIRDYEVFRRLAGA